MRDEATPIEMAKWGFSSFFHLQVSSFENERALGREAWGWKGGGEEERDWYVCVFVQEVTRKLSESVALPQKHFTTTLRPSPGRSTMRRLSLSRSGLDKTLSS